MSAAPTAVPNLAQIRLWGLLGKSVKYNENFIYLFIPFSGTHLQVRPVDGFSRLMAQTTRTRAVVCLLVVSLILLPIFGVKSPQNPNFGGVNRRFQAKQQNIESYILSKLAHRFRPNFDRDRDHQVVIADGLNTRPTNPRWRIAAILKKTR